MMTCQSLPVGVDSADLIEAIKVSSEGNQNKHRAGNKPQFDWQKSKKSEKSI